MIKLSIEVDISNKMSQDLISQVLASHLLTIEAYIKQLPGTIHKLETHIEGINRLSTTQPPTQY